MSKRMFRVTFRADVALDEKLVAVALDPKRRAKFKLSLRTPEDVARRLSVALVQGRSVQHIAGFADQAADAAILDNVEALSAVELRKGARHE